MQETLELGGRPLRIEDVVQVARGGAPVSIGPAARRRIARGRELLEERIAQGERIYGVNTGVGGNIGISVAPAQMETMQHNLVRHLACATGQPLPRDVVRAATLLRVATFLTGASAVRVEAVEALAALLNSGVTPVVPRYGSVGASGDLMPSAYIARVLVGMGEAEFDGRRMPAEEALAQAGLAPMQFAPKEALALINGTTVMTAVAALVWLDSFRVLRALLGAVALSVEALQAPSLPFEPWVQELKGHPGQIAVAAHMRELLRGSGYTQESSGQTCYSLRCVPQGLGPAWEALEIGRATVEREINSANDNPLIDPETGRLYKAGNFYGGHIARLLDTWKLDFAAMANWGNALMAVLVDDRFSGGLPMNLTPHPGVNCGFKGMQLSVTSLTCAVRQMAGPSSIHSLPTEQYNQDVVSLGMHAAVTAMDALECVRNETAMLLLASSQAVDLRGGAAKLGAGSRTTYHAVREVARFQDVDRPMEREVAEVAARIADGLI
ncbi:MAG TPA: aromatic amino acid ammonia-lyase [Bryobacteraceae bacterium]|jgi:phenylalanine ammonia-lyase|nr:aromatic amino acid ammonia-lyase [Bryobacteraceae bacterium]